MSVNVCFVPEGFNNGLVHLEILRIVHKGDVETRKATRFRYVAPLD